MTECAGRWGGACIGCSGGRWPQTLPCALGNLPTSADGGAVS